MKKKIRLLFLYITLILVSTALLVAAYAFLQAKIADTNRAQAELVTAKAAADVMKWRQKEEERENLHDRRMQWTLVCVLVAGYVTQFIQSRKDRREILAALEKKDIRQTQQLSDFIDCIRRGIDKVAAVVVKK